MQPVRRRALEALGRRVASPGAARLVQPPLPFQAAAAGPVAPLAEGGLGLDAPALDAAAPPVLVGEARLLGPDLKAQLAAARAQRRAAARPVPWRWPGWIGASRPARFASRGFASVASSFIGVLFVALAVAAALALPALAPHVVRAAAAAAVLSEDIAAAVGAGAHLISNVTTGVTLAASSLGNGGLSFTHEAWSGVDLHNVSVTRSAGRLLADDPRYLRVFLDTVEGTELLGAPAPLAVDVGRRVLAAVAVSLPAVSKDLAGIDLAGGYFEYGATARVLSSGWIAFEWEFLNVTFELMWANPLWCMAEFDPSTEIEAIQGRLHSAIKGSFGREARRNDTHAFTDADVPVLLFSRARRLLRWAEIRLYDAMQSFLWPLL